MGMRTKRVGKMGGLVVFLLASAAAADEAPPPQATVVAPAPLQKPAVAETAPLYSSPWMMRSLMAGNALRFDNSVAAYNDNKGKSGLSNVTLISGGYRVWRNLQLSMKLGVVELLPNGAPAGYSVLNGVIGALYSVKLPRGFYITPSLGFSLPWGMGGGDGPDATTVAANKAGALNRQVLEGSIFGVNFLAINPGVSVGWVKYGVTVQLDAQIFQSFRVRGSDATEPDHMKTNFWGGLHLGYFIIPQLSIGSEVHYQRYLTDVAAVTKDPNARDAVSGSIGLRGHFRSGRTIIKPGASYTRTVVGQGAVQNLNVVQLELAFNFR